MLFRTLRVVVVITVLVGIGSWLSAPPDKYQVTIAAGPSTGEAYRLLKALQKVAHRHHDNISIEVFETRGSMQNMKLLADNRVNMAAVQADLITDGTARMICELYSDMFQLVVRSESGIQSMADLKGKRVALPFEKTGEYEDFLFLARHYGLSPDDITLMTGTESSADWLFIDGDVDAVFRVRGSGNTSILQLIEQEDATIIPIKQADALKLRKPALLAETIAVGSYRGYPPVPAIDTVTVASKRLLLARSDVPDAIVYKLTATLFENRRELVELDPLTGFVSLPRRAVGTLFPIHPGTQQFMDRDEPSLIQRYAPASALVVSLTLLYLSSSLQFSAWRRRRTMAQYNRGLLQLADTARRAQSHPALRECQSELLNFVERVVGAGEAGEVSTADMALFDKAYKAAEEAILLRRTQLDSELFRFDRERVQTNAIALEESKQFSKSVIGNA